MQLLKAKGERRTKKIVALILLALCAASTMMALRTVWPATQLLGDVNGDGKVDLLDATAAAASFGKTTGDIGFNTAADINGDGKVDIFDLLIIAMNFGKTGV